MLSETTTQELKQILKEEYGQDLNLKETFEIAHMLVDYFNLLTRISHREKELEDNYDDRESANK